ncbi:MAG: protein kinase [Planctomycetaceae bacterium]
MSRCEVCGRPLNDPERYAANCPHCGASLAGEAAPSTPEHDPEATQFLPDADSHDEADAAAGTQMMSQAEGTFASSTGRDPEATIVEDDQLDSAQGDSVPSDAARRDAERTVLEGGAAAPVESPLDRTVVEGVMQGADVSRTINLSELPPEEAAAWSRATGIDTGEAGTYASTGTRDTDETRASDGTRVSDGGDAGRGSWTIDTGTHLVLQERAMRRPGEDAVSPADYELVSLLGEGGMGVVYSARQSSVDRDVAVKMLKGKLAASRKHRDSFLSEAVVTGDLDHPNIVPIHDLGRNRDGALFYSMKMVEGTPWNQVIHKKKPPENVEILMKVADAIAFAHSRGVVHRDLKPENIMLGGFGEVLVMDWGLALPLDTFRKSRSVVPNRGIGGSPAYMAPELATGPIDKIGPHSDVYLLGAILYEIVTGWPPHAGTSVTDCIRAAATNVIQPTRKTGELLDIALKAMATASEDRYASVQDFQQAIRDYQAHHESLVLSFRADTQLRAALDSDKYEDYGRCVFAFEEALALWNGNTAARAGAIEARRAYAQSALAKGDLDLGSSLLAEDEPKHAELRTKLRAAQAEREHRHKRLRIARRVAIGLVATIFVVVSGAAVWINNERTIANRERVRAEEQKVVAEEQRGIAEEQRLVAVANEQLAREEKIRAEKNADEAKRQQMIAEMERTEADAQRMIAEMKRKEADDQREIAETKTEEALEQKRLADIAKDNAVKQQEIANEQRRRADKQRELADASAKEATKQATIATEQREKAEMNEAEANRQKVLADKAAAEATRQEEIARKAEAEAKNQEMIARANADEARRQQAIAEYEAYVAAMGLAESKIRTNAFDEAARILDGLRNSESRGWEWGRLWHLVQQGSRQMDLPARVDAVAVSPDGSRFAAGAQDGRIRIWSSDLLAEPIVLKHAQAIQSLAFSPDGTRLASASNDAVARIWNVADGAPVAALRGHEDVLSSVAYSRDGRQLVTGSYDRTARVWNAATGEAVQTLRGHSGWVRAVAISPDAGRIVTAGEDGRAVVWRRTEGDSSPEFVKETEFTGHAGPVLAAAFSPDGTRIATGGEDRRVLVWNPDDSTVKPADIAGIIEGEALPAPRALALEGHAGPVHSVSFADDSVADDVAGSLVLSGSDDHSLKIWDARDGELLNTLRGHGGWVRSCAFSPRPGVEGGRVVVSGGHDRKVRLWNVDEYAEVRIVQEPTFTGHADAVLSAAFDHAGKRIVTSSRDRTARIWDAASGAARTFEEGHEFLASTAICFPDEPTVLTAAIDGTVRLWDAENGTQFARLEGTGRYAVAALSRDGRWILTGGNGNEARLWEVARALDGTGREPRRVLSGHEAKVTAVAFSPDSKTLFTADETGLCVLRDRDGGDELARYRTHTRRVNAAAFLPDGSAILTASSDGTIGWWDVASQAERRERVLAHGAPVTAMSLAPDGRSVVAVFNAPIAADASGAAGGRTFRLRTWDVPAARERWTAELGVAAVGSVEFSPDGRRTLVAQTDDRLRLWDAASGTELGPAGTPREAGGVPYADLSQAGGSLWSATYAADGSFIVLVGGNEARRWNVASRQIAATFRPHDSVATAGFSADGRYVVTGSWDHSVKIWNAATGASEFKLEEKHHGAIASARFSPIAESYSLLTAGADGTARLWDWDPEAREISLAAEFRGHEKPLVDAVFSPDGRRILTASEDGTAKLWDLSGRELAVLKKHDLALTAVAFSPDGKRALTGSEDMTAIVWELARAEPVVTLAGHTATVASVAFSPDGGRALTGSRDKSAKLWDATTGTELLTLGEHEAGITSVSFSPDGRHALTAGLDGRAILWPSASPDALPRPANPPAAE